MKETMKTFCNEVIEFIKGFDPNFTCNVKLDYSAKRTVSNGGCTGISIAMNRYKYLREQEYKEYESFWEDIFIGNFYAKDNILPLKAVICHEIAHSWQYYKQFERGHSNDWKFLYRILRERFVNRYIDSSINNITSKEQKLYERYCEKYNLKKEWFNEIFYIKDIKYKITGWNPRARKYYVRIVGIEDKKSYIVSPSVVVKGMS